MKRFLFVFSTLLILGSFCACSSSDEIDTGSSDRLVDLTSIEKDSASAISDFFKIEFGSYMKQQKPFDFKSNLSNEENPCIIINNEEEFKEAYTGDLNLPYIDFSKYTLVIGKIYLSAGTFINDMSIRQIDNNKVTLAINCIIDSKGSYISVDYYEYYWKLFPKFHASEIMVKISKEYGEIYANNNCYVITFCTKGDENSTALVYKMPQGYDGPVVNDYLIFPSNNINLKNINTGDLIMINIKNYMYCGVHKYFNGRYLCEIEPCQ
jgi:hypothetical protein